MKSFEKWVSSVPQSTQNEPIWKFLGYRKTLFLHEDEVIALIVNELNYKRRKLNQR